MSGSGNSGWPLTDVLGGSSLVGEMGVFGVHLPGISDDDGWDLVELGT